jgi:glyoxylase I family protein
MSEGAADALVSRMPGAQPQLVGSRLNKTKPGDIEGPFNEEFYGPSDMSEENQHTLGGTPQMLAKLWLSFSVSNLQRSIDWYGRVLGFEVTSRDAWSGGEGALLRHSDSGLEIGLIRHDENSGQPFSEFRCGLDHLEFAVPDRPALDAWVDRLDTLGVDHSGVKKDRIVTFRDPDNIQFEFFLGAGSGGAVELALQPPEPRRCGPRRNLREDGRDLGG